MKIHQDALGVSRIAECYVRICRAIGGYVGLLGYMGIYSTT